MTSEESNARWLCCPLCDKKKCDREAEDCDVKRVLADKRDFDFDESSEYVEITEVEGGNV